MLDFRHSNSAVYGKHVKRTAANYWLHWPLAVEVILDSYWTVGLGSPVSSLLWSCAHALSSQLSLVYTGKLLYMQPLFLQLSSHMSSPRLSHLA